MFSDVFLSHSSKDKSSLVEVLAAHLQARGLVVGYDAYNYSAGDDIAHGYIVEVYIV